MDTGRVSGIFESFKKGWDFIWSRVSLFVGSRIRSLEIRFLALLEIEISSLKAYWHYLIFLYVFFTSDVSNGGLPYNKA